MKKTWDKDIKTKIDQHFGLEELYSEMEIDTETMDILDFLIAEGY